MRHLPPVTAALLILHAAGAMAQDCPRPDPREPQRRYVNPRIGVAFTYPTSFRLDPDSMPPAGDSARFWTADRRATVVVNAQPNTHRLPLARLLAEAEGDVLQNARGEITYRRLADTWFVISGHMVGRIFYRRTLLTSRGQVATLWMEFPRELRDCLDVAVATMSLSFREIATPRPSP